ncbi:glycosyltransferase family 4 protein [Streptomyces hokutonensis]|uniref:glycosyltransferase family 4 protein n=1 Tax=Streptomyces hokutonensis TaxID=1306990 RepID=UPI001319FAD1|nr:glycosyltransferase family 4 protein [Streptomyces hokutonensis]
MRRDLRVVAIFETAGFSGSIPVTGGAARTIGLNRHLPNQGCEVTLVLCDLNPASKPSGDWPIKVEYVGPDDVYSASEEFCGLIAGLRPDVVVMSSTPLVVRYGRTLAERVNCRLVYDMFDNEHQLHIALGDDERTCEQRHQLQAAAISLADAVLVQTAEDLAYASTFRANDIYMVPCGVELSDPTPIEPRTRAGSVFVGNFYYELNAVALKFILNSLASDLVAAGRWVDVYGRIPPNLEVYDVPGVRVHGQVPSIGDVLHKAEVGLAPLASGGGMKLKVLEYMAASLPIIGPPNAFVGIPEPERFAVVTDDQMQNMARELLELLKDPARRLDLGASGRAVVERSYSWSSIAKVAGEAYNKVGAAPIGRRSSVKLSPDVVDLASAPPRWLAEWRRQRE